MCWIPFDCSHIPDQAVFFVNSCLIKICKVVISCRGCINMRLGLSRCTVDVQPDKIGRAYKNKGRLHIPQFHKSGFTLRKANSVDTYCTEWYPTGSFTDIHLQRSCKPFPWRVNSLWKRIKGQRHPLCILSSSIWYMKITKLHHFHRMAK